jgi:hypothetical protein
MPYHDQTKPFVNAWFASTEASNAPKFVDAISEGNQDRLEAEGGACILYTHFGHGFVRDRAIPDRVCELLRRLSGKNGWFVPVSTLLDHLRARSGIVSITPAQRRALEARWLFEKLVRGAS